jgi:hypothetical protein
MEVVEEAVMAESPARKVSAKKKASPALERRPARKVSPALVICLAAALVVLLGGGLAVAVFGWFGETKESPPKALAGGPQPLAGQNLNQGPIVAPNRPGLGPVKKPEAGKTKTAGVSDWLQDLGQAKRQATQEDKDILILFEGSDWCLWSTRLGKEVLESAEFQGRIREKFVPVLVDFPHKPEARAKVKDARRNERVADDYDIDGFPTVILTDAKGRPYATEGYKAWGPDLYGEHLSRLQGRRTQRDALLATVGREQGLAKLLAAKAALEFLDESGFHHFYARQLGEWLKLARDLDPANAQGHIEVFFESDWLLQARQAGPEETEACIDRLDAWKKKYKFRDPDRAALIHLMACRLLAAAGDRAKALTYAKAGLKYGPTNPILREYLANPRASLGFSSGTGFVVTTGGLILTNHHVIRGQGRILVRIPGVARAASAEVIAQDDARDMALLRMKVPKGTVLRPLAVPVNQPVGRGEEVAAFGYPLGDWLGGQVKLTRGVISAVPEPGNENHLLLDAKVNPGNSGGPLCDLSGNVVGLVSAKSRAGGAIDSYGLALPAADLDAFLKKHIKGVPADPAAR